jgi:predicted small lipoprotein YifL
MNKSLRSVLFLSACTLLAACGAKGALILPEKAVPIEAPAEPAVETSAPADDSATTPADQQAEEAVEVPTTPGADD